MRWLKGIAFFILVLIGFVGIFAALGKYYYENEVKQYVKSELNNLLATPIDVNEINFSLLQKFPSASLSFEEVLAWDAFPGQESSDTLFYAKKIFLEFNIFDLLRKKYNLEKIAIVEADIRLKWNKKGEGNYVIWKEQSQAQDNEFKLNLSLVQFTDCKLLLDHYKSEFISKYDVDELVLEGNLNNKIIDLKVKGKLNSFSHITNNFSYGSNKKLSIKTLFKLDIDNKDIQFSDASINWNGLVSAGSGTADYGKDFYSFIFEGKEQSLSSIIRILPESFTKDLSEYSFSSTIDFKLETSNNINNSWKTQIDFSGKNGKVTHLASSISVNGLAFKGSISTLNSNTSININSYSGSFSGGNFNGKLAIKNLEHPSINVDLKGVFDLSELIPFFINDQDIISMGSINADMHFSGSFYDFKNIQKKEIEKAITTGLVELNNVTIYLPRLNLELKELMGSFKLDDNDATIPNLNGKWMGSNMELKGNIENLMPFILLEDQKLIIRAKGHFDHIDLERLLTTEGQGNQNESFEIPRYLSMDIEAKIDEISYKKFISTEVFGHFLIQNGRLRSDDFGFNTAGGDVRGYLSLLSSKNADLELEVQAKLINMDISKLFYEFDNMGQKIITDKNISGALNADVMFKGVWDKDLNMDLSKMVVLANVNVDNGQLKDVKSLDQIGDYLQSNALASAFVDTKGLNKKLKDIHFDHMQNQIEIKNKVITIPEMQILSDAIDINLSGKHYFDNRISYSINFRLREIMKQLKETEFGIIEDDGLGSRIFLKMEGTTENPIFSLDKSARKEWKQESWKQEKQAISTLLDQEFKGMFGGEKGEKPKEAPKKFKIEWDDVSDSTLLKSKTDSTEKKRKTLIFQSDDSDIRDSDDDDY